jgi:hypothetical protein
VPEQRPSLAYVLRRTAHRARARGPREVLGLAWQRLRENLSSDAELVFFARAPGGAPPARPDVSFREAGGDDAGRYAAEIGTESPGTFRARLSDSTRCYLALDPAGRLLHASWTTTSSAWTRELRGRVTPPAGAAYVYESFTVPAARGRGLYPFALASICARLAGRIETIWVAVEADNPASLRAVSKAGFEAAFRRSYRRRRGRRRRGEPQGPRAHEARHLLQKGKGVSRSRE